MVQRDIKTAQVERAIDTAEKALLTAQQSERFVQQAADKAHPQLIAHAQAHVEHAAHVVDNAIEHLKGNTDEHREQMVVQTLDQLEQAKQDLEDASQVISTPRQVR